MQRRRKLKITQQGASTYMTSRRRGLYILKLTHQGQHRTAAKSDICDCLLLAVCIFALGLPSVCLYLPIVILTIIWYSITHSLCHSRLKTFLFCKSFPPQPFFFLLPDSLHGFPRLFTVISEHICFLLLVFLFLHFLVVGSVR